MFDDAEVDVLAVTKWAQTHHSELARTLNGLWLQAEFGREACTKVSAWEDDVTDRERTWIAIELAVDQIDRWIIAPEELQNQTEDDYRQTVTGFPHALEILD